MKYRPDFQTVKAAAAGRWLEVLTYLGIDAGPLSGKHCPCPACGGRDRFRWDAGKEAFFCGGGGNLTGGDGFALLEHCGWSKSDSLHAVAQFFNVERVFTTPEQRQEIKQQQLARKRAKYEATLSHEMHVLSQIVNPRVSGRQLASNKRFRDTRPEWTPPPDEHWAREVEAARTIHYLTGLLYGASDGGRDAA